MADFFNIDEKESINVVGAILGTFDLLACKYIFFLLKLTKIRYVNAELI